ncbi:MAG: sensor histidine kinase [Candidatus Methylomirabilales bacterium]
MPSRLRYLSSRTKMRAAAFFVVLIPALILGVLGFITLRRWEKTARQVMLDSYLKTATMAVEKIEETILRSEEEFFHRIGGALRKAQTPSALQESIMRVEDEAPLGGALYVLDAKGGVVYSPLGRLTRGSVDARMLNRLRREAITVKMNQGRIHRLLLKEEGEVHSLSFARVPGPGVVTYLIGFRLDRGTVNPLFWAMALDGGTSTDMSILAILDQQGAVVYSPRPLRESREVASAPFREIFPLWKVAVYQQEGMAFEDSLHWQVLVSGLLIAMLVVVIAGGLLFIFRFLRREMEMAQLKAEFVTHVSHDLKTPVALIRMYAETLEMGRIGDEGKRQEYYRIIARESECLTHLINSFLDFSRIDVGKARYHFQPCEVVPLILQTLEVYQYQLNRLGFTVDLEMQPDMPDVTLDPDAFRQALGNVIDNAINYSGDRKVIRVGAMVWEGELRCSIADQGVGIDSAEVPRIFEKYYRAGRRETPSPRGSGIGLTLVKNIAEAHGGRVIVESARGEGSTFTLIIPVDPDRRGVS